MVEVMRNIVSRAKNAKLPGVVPELSDDDIVSIWDTVSGYIERQMGQQKGVQIPGLGIFTLTQQKLDVGNSKYLLLQRPVFQVSEKFIQTHQISSQKYHLTGQVPVTPLNYSALAMETPFTRDAVESCIREVLQALAQAVAAKKNVEFTFTGIGKLSIREGKVKMKFYKEFVNSMDGTGQLVGALQGRPGTVDSVMTNRPPSRAVSQNTFTLPRDNGIQPGQGLTNSMETIKEEKAEQGDTDHKVPMQNSDDAHMQDGEDHNEHVQNTEKKTTEESQEAKETATTRPAMPLAQAALSFLDDLQTSRAASKMAAAETKMAAWETQREAAAGQEECVAAALPPLSAPAATARLVPSPPSQLKKPSPPPKRPHTSGSECGHASAGQELCYLCHQRAKRNVAVSFDEERKRREEEEDRLLNQYRQMKDTEALVAEREAQLAKRHDLQKAAAFNLGIAEATNIQKKEKDGKFQPSFIFQRRPVTPPRFYKQEKYNRDLEHQVRSKVEAEEKQKSDEAFLERLEQVHLAEDLAVQRELMVRQRAEQRDLYQKSLDQQLLMKPFPIPARVPHGTEPMIPGEDNAPDRQLVRRRIAHQILQDQKEAVEQRKRSELIRKIQEQTDESQMLDSSKKELLQDRAREYQRRVHRRRALEEDWAAMLSQKKLREAEDKERHRSMDELYHEQCDQYSRCGQCRRRLTNCGETNVWKESYYVPGARIIL